MELGAAGVGLARLRRQGPRPSSYERAPPNAEIVLEFLLHVSGRSDYAMALAQKVRAALLLPLSPALPLPLPQP